MPAKGLAFFCLLAICISGVSCHHTDDHLFTQLDAGHTNIDFKNVPLERKAFGFLYYLYYYNGGGVATGDVNGDGLPDIYFTANNKGANKLYINKGGLKFEDVTEKAGVAGTSDWCTGATMADVNGDGLMDIYVSAVAHDRGLQGHNELFINKGDGTFTESAAQYGLDFSGYTSQAVFFDYDHDGDLDCFLVNQSHQPNQNIVDTSHRHKIDPFAGDRLYRNDLNTPAKKFTDVSAQAGIYQSSLGYGLGISVADMNNDGWDDIYIGNDFHENDYYYINNGNGTFTESGAQHFGHYSRFSMGNDIADYNNDGQPDVVTVDMLPEDEKTLKTYGSDENADIYQMKIVNNGYQYQYSRNCLQRNNGSGSSFSETGLISGVSATDWSWCPLFADLDNDGNKDLFISSGIVKRPVDLDYIKFSSDYTVHKALNSSDRYDQQALDKMPDGSSHPYLYRGDGDIRFEDVSQSWGTGDMKGYYNGAAYADLDNDGDLDLVINSINAPAVVLRNDAPKKNWLTLSFKGSNANTKGVGCKAYVFAKGKMQYAQLMLTRGFESASEERLHFGLDRDSLADSLLVVWPDQTMQMLRNVKADQQIVLRQQDASGHFDYASRFPPQPALLAQSTQQLDGWKHQEDNFFDNNVQYLIPHGESTRGPKMAIADVNSDGRDDVYACGAKGQGGTLLLQQSNGNFVPADTSVFRADAACEDVDALFFDANGDGKPDLYVVSGGNEYTGQVQPLLDRLYLNDGKGHFTKSTSALPELYANKSCVTAADIDHDGDLDLFVGTLADAKAYGIPQTSYLLLNDGKGHFTQAPATTIGLKDIGMVTAAAFADMNGDGWPDLVVAGEWMPITIFTNHNGQFTPSTIPHSSGWWQSIMIDDADGDGQPDILAGNWGCNNKFWSGKNGPVRLYVSDFDKNGQVDQLLSYTKDGEEYPFLAKDEVERELPVLRKHYLLYSDYAGVPMKDVFYGFAETVKPLVAEHLASVICYGDGKGGYTMHDLPQDLQLAPVFSFQSLKNRQNGQKHYIMGGNFYETIPYEGRYDGQPLAAFSIDGKKNIHYIMQTNLAGMREQVRDIKRITVNGKSLLMVSGNNTAPVFFNEQ